MKTHLKIFYLILKLIRFILNIPSLIFIIVRTIYAKLLILIDPRNHRAYWQEILQIHIDKFKSKKIIISQNPYKHLQFYVPTQVAGYRVKTFFTKEPETIEWINKNGSERKVFLDIGANMGVYSLYYAKKFGGKVFSFEPSFKNLELLSKNIKINSLQKNITLISNPLSDTFKIANFYQEDFVGGEANASLISNDNLNVIENKKLKNNDVLYSTLGLPLDNLANLNLINKSLIVKIDVDGNELDILNGAKKILSQNINISLLVEVRDQTEFQIEEALNKLNFKKIEKFEKNNNIIYEK